MPPLAPPSRSTACTSMHTLSTSPSCSAASTSMPTLPSSSTSSSSSASLSSSSYTDTHHRTHCTTSSTFLGPLAPYDPTPLLALSYELPSDPVSNTEQGTFLHETQYSSSFSSSTSSSSSSSSFFSKYSLSTNLHNRVVPILGDMAIQPVYSLRT